MRTIAAFLVVLSLSTIGAHAVDAPQTYALVVAGDGGEANFTENYKDWCVRLHALLTGDLQIPAANVKVLMEKQELAPFVSAVSTKENVIKAFGELAAKATPADQFILVYIGHGTAQGSVGKLCIPGPDISSDDTAEWLGKLKAREVVFINSAAGSSLFLEKCSAPRRVVITATNNSAEGNETYFMEFLLQAYEKNKGKAPLDLLAAFNSAASECPKWYLRQYYNKPDNSWRTEGRQSRALWQKFYGKIPDKKMAAAENPDADDAEPPLGEWGEQWASRRMPTEHAQLDDNGDKLGTAVFGNNQFTPVTGSEEGADGFVARKIVLGKPGSK